MTTVQVLPLRLVTGATPERVRRAAWSLRPSGSAASVSKVASMIVPTPGRERRIAASPGPRAAAVASWLNSGAELVELVFGLVELGVGQAQPGHQGAEVQDGGLGDTSSHRDGRLAQHAEHARGIEAAD